MLPALFFSCKLNHRGLAPTGRVKERGSVKEGQSGQVRLANSAGASRPGLHCLEVGVYLVSAVGALCQV